MKKIIILLIIAALAHVQSTATVRPRGKVQNISFRFLIHYPELKSDDELALFIPKPGLVRTFVETGDFNEIKSQTIGNGWFLVNCRHVKSTQAKGMYVVLAKLSSHSEQKDTSAITSNLISYYIMDHYYVQNEDNVTIDVKKAKDFAIGRSSVFNFKFQFTGKGAKKYQIRYVVDSIAHSYDFVNDYINVDSTYNQQNFENKKINNTLLFLKNHRKLLPDDAYIQLKLHVIYQTKVQEALLMRHYLKTYCNNASASVKSKLVQGYLQYNPSIKKGFEISQLIANYDYWYAELGKAELISSILNRDRFRDSIVRILASYTSNFSKEKLVVLALREFSGDFFDNSTVLNDARKVVKTPNGLKNLQRLTRCSPGNIAYDFNLTDANGKKVSLSSFKGKIVFIDFWYTGCGNCLNYYQNVLSKVEDRFQPLSNIVFVTISIDKDVEFWKHSLNTGRYTSPLAVNLYTNGDGILNDVIKYYNVLSYPNPLLIGKDQRIIEMGDSLRSVEGIVTALISIDHFEKKGN